MGTVVYNPGRCQDYGKSIPLERVKYEKEDVTGGYRVFHLYPYYGHELRNKVGLVDDGGNPISTER